MTRYWARYDRYVRLLSASRRLLVEINNLSDRVMLEQDRPRGDVAASLYARARRLVTRIDRELSR
jgi:hypothetical protein